ncbi:EAL domain-containing protein [Spongiibacter sp. KMU-158]|uniref:EAL domain-containing protein n=1 Tax=Spongiibacter pelagi TaxID=2760804 RepID=A0A927BYS9_9GAMM|nr:EAL domain-containing protein [Spongiibacter pelagi]MBD2858059.1 EAL domain-containing protein [Spongiibacter pelagi]
MTINPIINALFIQLGDDDISQLISRFRQAGNIVREHNAHTTEQLPKLLEDKDWDLIFLDEHQNEISPKQIQDILTRLHKSHLPILMISDGAQEQQLDPALAGVFSRDEMPRLVQACQRELRSLALQRELGALRKELEASSHRNQLLLSEHNDAICYVIDGMIIHANPRFWSLLGTEELDGFPIIDLVQTQDQEVLKGLLKKVEQEEESPPIEVRFIKEEESLRLKCLGSLASYEGESCIQLTLQEQDLQTGGGLTDISTGFASRQHFLSLLQAFLDGERNNNHAMIMIGLDDYSEIRSQFGVLDMEQLVSNLSQTLQNKLDVQLWGRLADDIFCALSKLPSNNTLDMVQKLGHTIEGQMFETHNKSQQCTITGVIYPINHLTPPSSELAIKSSFGLLKKLQIEGGNRSQIFAKDRQQLTQKNSVSEVVAEAIADKRLQLLYQPMVNLGDAHGDYYEVQLDIKDREEDEVSGGELLRTIEREPHDNKLDRWIVMEATKQLSHKRQAGEETVLVINLSSNVFHDTEFCPWLTVAIRASGLPTEAVILQFSEQSIASNLKLALDFNRQLSSLGMRLAVRNFCRNEEGNKFLSHLQPSMVKPGIRKEETISNEDVRRFVQLAKELQARITIPNVTSAAALANLWQIGPDFIQGSYINEPQPSMSYEFSSF